MARKEGEQGDGRELKVKFGAKVFTDEGGKRDGPRIIWLYVLFKINNL